MLPQLMIRIWDGDPDERFTHTDMNRVRYNADILSREVGLDRTPWTPSTRADQFDYSEAQRLENQLLDIATAMGETITIESAWGVLRTLSYVDFERWEANTWQLYHALGGVGERIPAEKFLHTVNATLFAGSWKGTGPYYQDLDVPMVHASTEVIAYLSENIGQPAQMSAYSALLQAVYVSDRIVRVYAHGSRPTENIPIKFSSRPFEMYKEVILPVASWTGDGPWTQTVDMGSTVANAVIGSDSRNSPAQVSQFAGAIITVSAINGSAVTVRAIGEKPTTDLYATFMWSDSAVTS